MGYSYNKTEALRGTTFKVQLEDNWFSNGDILDLEVGGYQVKVVNTPHRLWWKILLEWITFRWYKAPYQYTLKRL